MSFQTGVKRGISYIQHRFSNVEWEESKHPRADDGKFGSGGGGLSVPKHLKDIKVPPAWKDVWYNPDPNGTWWVKGKDAKGRSQGILNPEADSKSQKAKFYRVKELDRKFQSIKKQIEKDQININLREQATCMQLIVETGIRPGSDKDTKAEVRAYGATTLEGRHVVDRDGNVFLEFIGKKGVPISVSVIDLKLSKDLLSRKLISGDGGKLFKTNYQRLLSYSHKLDGGGFKTKDFRTLLGTSIAVKEINKSNPPSNEKEYKKRVAEVAKKVANKLGNTPTVALQRYINPTVFKVWQGAFNGVT